jgi:transglutaminase-like putative cysteine protease
MTFSQVKYSIASIPDSLKKNANVVYMLDEGEFEITADDKAVLKVREVIAILNAKGKHHAVEVVGYDKLIKLNSFSGSAYDATGKLIKKIKKSEISDQSSISGFSIYEDNRIKIIDLKQHSYPYIVTFEYEVEYKYLYSIPDWWIVKGDNISTMKSSYRITSPKKYQPRVRIINADKVLSVVEEGAEVTISATFENVMAMEVEPYGPGYRELSPQIQAAPKQFNFEGYQGDMSTWESYGKWQNVLNEGRSEIPLETKREIRALVLKYHTTEEKTKAIYEYVQNKTRYVSIQLGIGGFQPFPAATVDELGYGDCKALSNYTQSLLGAVGIDSHYTWVYGGNNPPKLSLDFPDDKFNHIILCVPNKQDTIWLECTSQTNPFGYMGKSTGDRDVMLVTDDGGKIVHTPVYPKEVNTQTSTVKVDMKVDGSAKASIAIEYAGLQYENNGIYYWINQGHEEKKKWINEHTDIADFIIEDFNFKEKRERIPSITETLNIVIPRLTSMRGKRMFITPNLLNKWSYTPPRMEDRQTDVILKQGYIDIDTVIYQIPEKFHKEHLPEAIAFESPFGSYHAGFTFENNQLIYVRKMEVNKGRFPASSYGDFRQFRKDVIKADNQKVVFIDKT